ncbi:MAG: CPBP family intramembrane metalloprotease [Bacteroidales bacterium]|nr:CPBP family intramembrane metalloprotease [Bacteroidales bacterium]
MNEKLKQVLLGGEFILLFFGVPLFIVYGTAILHPTIVILPVLLLIFLLLRFTTSFRFGELISWNISRRVLVKNGTLVLVIALLLFGSVVVFDPENLFNLPRGNLRIWIFLCIFYPLFSAYGQEIIFRTFVFHRYRKLFKRDIILILASGITFSFAHIIYFSWISIILTLLAGLYFAYEYNRTKSVLFTSVLHGVLGDVVFTVGLGHHFWVDMFNYL